MNKIIVIDYGAGNVRSVGYALERMGFEPILTHDSALIRSASRIVFPGVGHAHAAMNALRRYHLDEVIPSLTQPVLGICLGMQLLGDFSEEGNTKALGIVDAPVKRFEPVAENAHMKIPHMGWNTLGFENTPKHTHPILEGVTAEDYFYFVHTYYMPVCEDTVASADYINEFSAIVARDNFIGCQFHPEKSGAAGRKILENFLKIK